MHVTVDQERTRRDLDDVSSPTSIEKGRSRMVNYRWGDNRYATLGPGFTPNVSDAQGKRKAVNTNFSREIEAMYQE
jgi:hypothetical protein